MIPFRADITINRRVSEVFEFVADPQNFSNWMSGVKHAEALSTAMESGSQVRLAGRFGLWDVDAPFEITAYKPNQEFGMKGAAGPIWFDGKWDFEGGNDSVTRLTVKGEYKMLGLWRLAEPIFAGEMQNGEAQELAKIKAQLEG